MSNIDKRALREAAEKAGADEWCAFIDTKSKTYSVHTPGDNRCGDVVKWAGFDGQQRAAAKAKFIAAANPATILALLDELEAKDRRWADSKTAQQTALEYTAGIENQLEDALSRIAELDARYQPKFVQCWLCKHDIEVLAIADCDGYCPRCAAPIDLDDEPYAATGKGE